MRNLVARLFVSAGFALGAAFLAPAAWAGTTPYEVRADSVSDSAVTVSWVTTTAEAGYVEYGTSSGSLTSIAYDTRGSSTSDNVHFVVIGGLSASTTYHWKIVSGGTEYGDASGNAYETTTGSSLILLGSRFVTGQVLDEDGNAASNTLVHVTLRDADANGSSGDSQTKTVLTDSSGNWLFLLESFRTANLSSGFSVSTSGDTILVSADGGTLGKGTSSVDSSYASSSPTTITTSLVAPGVPVVSTVSPSQGTNTVATNVTLTGSNFLFATSSALDDGATTALQAFTVVSDTTITAQVPSGVVAGAYNVKVTSSAGTNATSAQTFTSAPPPSITDVSLAGWTVGQSYSHAIGVTGGASPLSWSVVSGTLPAGLSLSSAGLLSGNPTTAGTAAFTVRVTDNSGVTASQALTLTIAAAITTPSGLLPNWTSGRDYGSSTISTTGGTDTVTLTISGLPPGLGVSGTGRSRTVSGTPTTSGSYTVTATATDAVGSTASRTYTVVIASPVTQPLGTLPDWTSGRDYGSRTVTTTGGTDAVTWTTTGLPPGLAATATARTLTVSGTPTTAGSYSVVTTATDAAGSSASRTYTLTINNPLSQPSGTLPDWTVGRAYGSRSVTTTGGTDAITWTATGLPPGVSTSSSARTLTVSGTPTTAGIYSIIATATDAAGSSATRTFTVTISAPLTTPTGSLPNWTVGQAYGSRTLTTTGGTDLVTWTTTGLPPGLTAAGSARTLTVTGTPTTAGTFSVNATATDAAGSSASQTFAIVISAPVTAPSGSLPGWTQGRDYGTRSITTTGGTDPIAWTVTGLPPGLLSTSNGRTLTVVGTPNQTGTYSVSITATDNVGSTASTNWSIVISAPLTSPTGTLPDWTVGRAYGSRVLSTTGGTDPVTWTVSGLPPGTTATPSGRNLTVSGTPTTAGTYLVSLSLVDGAGSSASASMTVVINVPLTALVGALPDWTVGRSYGTRTVTTSGGTDPVTWTTTNLPSGLTASGSGRTLTISGFPDTAATYSLNVTATDAAGATSSHVYGIVINPALASPTGSLPDWTVGRDYGSRTLTTTGGTDPIDWSVTGLPAGLVVSPNGRTLTVTGTPTTAGTYSVVATVSDAAGGSSSRALTMIVNAPVTAAAGTVPDWTVGRPYGTRTLTTTGGTDPIGWTVTGLPTGISASSSDRTLTLTGTPTVTGTFSVSVTVTDGAGSSAARTIPVTINAAVTSPTGSLPDWTIGRDYGTRTLTTTGGTDQLTWSVTGLPAGLLATPNGRTLTIVGTPNQAGTFNVSAAVTDAAGSTASAAFTVTINVGLSAPAGSLPDWTVGRNYATRTITTTGGTSPVTWSVSGVPAGLATSFSGRSLDVSGTPTAVGTNSVILTATDAAGATATRTFTLVVNAALTQPSGSLPDWTIGRDYGNRTLTTTGGTDSISWNVTGLPTGLSSTPSGRNLSVSGIPTAAGSFDVTLTVTDVAGSSATRNVTIVINPALTAPVATLPDWTIGRDYGTRTATVTGGTAPLTWNVSGLPTGLTGLAEGSTFRISGTPTAAGSFIVLANVSDVAGATSTAAWLVTINSQIASPVGSLPNWTVGRYYGTSALTTTGGTNPVSWQVTGLPPGLAGTANGKMYTVTGTPTAVGTYSVSATVTDAAGATAKLDVLVVIGDVVRIDDVALGGWTIGRPYSQVLTSTGGTVDAQHPLRWELISGGVPGLSFDASGARLFGVPTMVGEFPVTFRATDTAGSTDEQSFNLTINSPISFGERALTFASVGREYADALTWTGGTAPFTLSVASQGAPSWLTLTADTGRFGGTPVASGVFDFDVSLTDVSGATSVRKCRLEVAAVVSLEAVDPSPPLTVAAGQTRLLVAFDALWGSSVKLTLSRTDLLPMPYTARLVRADGTDFTAEVAAKQMKPMKAKSAKGSKSLSLSVPKLPATDRYFVAIEALPAGAEFTMGVTTKVTYQTKFSGTVTVSPGVPGELKFAAPAGSDVSVKLKKRGSEVKFIALTHIESSDTVDLGGTVGPTLKQSGLAKWGDYRIGCEDIGGAVTTAFEVAVRVPKTNGPKRANRQGR